MYGLPSSPVAAPQLPEASNGISSCSVKEELPPTDTCSVKHEATSATCSPKALNAAVPSAFKKPIGAKRSGKIGGLGARKLATKPKQNIYDQKPEESELLIPTASSTTSSEIESSVTCGFEYNDDFQYGGESGGGGGTRVLSHVPPPKPSASFFADFRTDSALPKKSSSSSPKVEVEESDEARKKFTNAKSAQFFGDLNRCGADRESETTLEEVSKDVWLSVVNKARNMKEKLVADFYGVDIYGLRRDVTDLMEKIYAQDADAIPFETRREWLGQLRDRVADAVHLHTHPIYGPIFRSCKQDVWHLYLELFGPL